MGKLEKLTLKEVCNPPLKGGLGLPCIQIKANALFVRQTCRLLQDDQQLTYKHVKYWLGLVLMDIFPDMAGGLHAQIIPPYFKHMRTLFVDAVKSKFVDVKKLEFAVAKNIYLEYSKKLIDPPKITKKYKVDWEMVWKRLENPVLDTKGREIMIMIVHNIVPNRDRLLRLNQVENNRCLACQVIEDNVHYFMECVKVRDAWGWVRRRIVDLLPNMVSNWDYLHLVFPTNQVEKDILWLLSNFVEFVWQERRLKNRILGRDNLKMTFKFKFQEMILTNRPLLTLTPDIFL